MRSKGPAFLKTFRSLSLPSEIEAGISVFVARNVNYFNIDSRDFLSNKMASASYRISNGR